jgi:hypothetical protein
MPRTCGTIAPSSISDVNPTTRSLRAQRGRAREARRARDRQHLRPRRSPVRCSGLRVLRYDTESLHDEFGARFRLVDSSHQLHQTRSARLSSSCTATAESSDRTSTWSVVSDRPQPRQACLTEIEPASRPWIGSIEVRSRRPAWSWGRCRLPLRAGHRLGRRARTPATWIPPASTAALRSNP